jgi:hypothetical protein
MDCLLLFCIQAKAQAVQQGRWLLVNVQLRTEFPSYTVRFSGPFIENNLVNYLNDFQDKPLVSCSSCKRFRTIFSIAHAFMSV